MDSGWGREMIIFAAVVIVASLSAPAFAADYPVSTITTQTSAHGADKIAFLSGAGRTLREFSDRTGYEACAEIATDGDSYGVVITTSNSHIGCAIDTSRVPAGMHATGETIHSHGINTAFRPNRADRLFLGIDPHSRGQVQVVGGQNPEHFSDTDFAGSAGYLATPTGLKYQRGAGTEMRAGI